MRKYVYQQLEQFLRTVSGPTVSLPFPKIEEILGRKLPPTAYGNDTWWTNNPTGHSQAKAWLAAGFEMDGVDRAAMVVVFRRKAGSSADKQNEVRGMSEAHRNFEPAPGAAKSPRRSPLFGCMKGTFTIAPGWDVTRPALDQEELAEWEASLDRKADLIEQAFAGKPK
ncbi:MAG TPA: hypothetical protein VGM36_02240 [Rhizomicrobium sp.]|jgi:hypothetical protein